MDSRVQKAIVLMKENSRRVLSLGEIMAFVNLSASRLRLIFKATMGMPPMQYFKWLKMHEAELLLETSFLNIKQIAARVGIKDVSHFVRDFKKVYGVSPTQYRKRHHKAPHQRYADRPTN